MSTRSRARRSRDRCRDRLLRLAGTERNTARTTAADRAAYEEPMERLTRR